MGQSLSYEKVEKTEKVEKADPGDDLIQAVEQGDLKRLKSHCREHLDVDKWFREKSLLHHAVYYGQLECVKFMLAQGADPNSTSSSESTPLFEVFSSGTRRNVRKASPACDKSLIETLLKAKADINARNCAQRTPLLKSIIHNKKHITECLLAHNADVNFPDADGLLPIHVSATYSSLTLLRKLLKLKADINGQDARGRTALYFSILAGHKDIFQELIAMNCDVNLYSDLGCPLQVAVIKCQRDMVQVLLENEAFVGCEVRENRYSFRSPRATDILNLSLTVAYNKLTKAVANTALPLQDLQKALDVLDLVIQAYGSKVTLVHNPFFQTGYLNGTADGIADAKVIYRLQNVFQKLGFLMIMSNQRLPQCLHVGVFKLDEKYRSESLTLQNLCRMKVRGLVMQSRTNVIAAVKKLDCSVVIKDILLLKDIFKLI